MVQGHQLISHVGLYCPANVFALGDCSNVPTAKTAAAVAAESRVLKHNLLEVMKGNTPSRKVCR